MIPQYDCVVMGGGINGAAIACDAAGRGLSVLLCEQNDLASGTSSQSSKLIHGGLRYLEHFEFALVREALQERDILFHKAPHLLRPQEFIIPHDPTRRNALLIRAGLWLYDKLAGHKTLPNSHYGQLANLVQTDSLRDTYSHGFHYYDYWVDDARLVVLTAMAARERGAEIQTYTRCVQAFRQTDRWVLQLQTETQPPYPVYAHCLINATGPWINFVEKQVFQEKIQYPVRLIKGSHFVIRKFYPGNHAYLLQHTDQRVIFITPFFDDYLLVGTTDLVYEGTNLQEVKMSAEEILYLCDIFHHYFQHSITVEDILWSFAGVRPLFDDGEKNISKISREYVLKTDFAPTQAPRLSVYGGKLTTHRKLAENALNLLAPIFPQMRSAWTAHTPLPGGDISTSWDNYLLELKTRYDWLPHDLLTRYAHAYGTRIDGLLAHTKTMHDLGKHYGHGLYDIEIDYLKRHEWAKTMEDILWRRTKLGLCLLGDAGAIASF